MLTHIIFAGFTAEAYEPFCMKWNTKQITNARKEKENKTKQKNLADFL